LVSPAAGEYSFIEGYDRDADAEDVTGIHPFEELSLYAPCLIRDPWVPNAEMGLLRTRYIGGFE